MVLIVGADSTPVNLSFRLAYLVISVYLLGYGLFRSPILKELRRSLMGSSIKEMASGRLSTPSRLIPGISLILFWFIYAIRLVYDLEYKEWQFREYSNIYVYTWSFGCTLIPALAVLLNIGAAEAKGLSTKTVMFVVLVTLLIALILLFIYKSNISAIFNTRSAIVLTGEVKLRGQHVLNGITMSFYGALTLLTATTWFIFLLHRLSIFKTLFFVLCCLLGIFVLMAGASRGPFLDLVLISAGLVGIACFSYIRRLIQYVKHQISEKRQDRYSSTMEPVAGKSLVYKPLMILLAVFMLFTVANKTAKQFNISWQDLALVNRLDKALDENKDRNTTFRIDAWESAWHQFTINPVFGDSIINDVGYFYSHNIFMDALMSVGIVGTIPFLVWFFLSFWYFIRLPAYRKRELSVLFVAYLAALLLSMTSGGIFTVPEVWILSAAVIGLSQKYLLDEERTKS
ncbi:MAG: hypothetical protein EOM90_15055 [Alphaproteobacteria bacterium]|nr:hypothetical protein [Alphaproteobacteria bacterium]